MNNTHTSEESLVTTLDEESKGEIINKVATSTLITFDLEEYYTPGERAVIDIKDCLFKGLILREKEMRDFVRDHEWKNYQDKCVAIGCSVDAIVPTWAYMLVSASLQPFAKKITFGTLQQLETELYQEALQGVNWQKYQAAKVVIKGCSKVDVPVSAYVYATAELRKVASSIMYGEPCSTVPIFKVKMK